MIRGKDRPIYKLRNDKPEKSTSIELTNFLFFDIETTGLRPDRGAKITEISILDRNSQLYLWREDSGTFNVELQKVLQTLQRGVVAGHNLQFDFWFLSYEADRYGFEGSLMTYIDTLSLSRKLLPGKNRQQLSPILKEFDIRMDGKLHTAVTENEITKAFFREMNEKGGRTTGGKRGVKKIDWSTF